MNLNSARLYHHTHSKVCEQLVSCYITARQLGVSNENITEGCPIYPMHYASKKVFQVYKSTYKISINELNLNLTH